MKPNLGQIKGMRETHGDACGDAAQPKWVLFCLPLYHFILRWNLLLLFHCHAHFAKITPTMRRLEKKQRETKIEKMNAYEQIFYLFAGRLLFVLVTRWQDHIITDLAHMR